ncbi:MAG: hypothetical protein M3Y72_02250 [Acidobacteriota bacterium]|nr:hypothetical protein [Acidobacteriota bacterium]
MHAEEGIETPGRVSDVEGRVGELLKLDSVEIARRVDPDALTQKAGNGHLQRLTKLRSFDPVVETAPDVDAAAVGVG